MVTAFAGKGKRNLFFKDENFAFPPSKADPVTSFERA